MKTRHQPPLGGSVASSAPAADWERFASTVIEEMDEAILLLDAGGIIQSWNPGARRILGYSRDEVVGKPVRVLVPPERLLDLKRIQSELDRTGHAWGVDTEALASDGRRVPISVKESVLFGSGGELVGYALILYDLRERRSMERQLLRADRLATIGMLASSVAHEVGTPLNVILGRAELLSESLEGNQQALRQIEVITGQIQRIAGVVSRLLSFGREHSPGGEPVQLNQVLEDVVAFVEPRLRAQNVTYKSQLEPELPALRGDPTQLHQVFLNLVMNALDAMPDGGELRVSTRACQGSDVAPSSVALACSCVQAEVADTGEGVPAELQERIFHPFFTTKGQQRGTGLGLAIAREIVKSYSGQITVDSRPEAGARFVITIPHSDSGQEVRGRR